MEDNRNMETAEQSNGQQESQGQKVFTQEELEEIIKKRLARDRKSRPAEAEVQDRERDLDERENRLYARERFLEESIPSDLLELAAGKDKEQVDKMIQMLKPYVEASKGPAAKTAAWGMRHGARAVKNDGIREAMGLDRKG